MPTQHIKEYAAEVSSIYKSGITTEHSFRGSLQTLLNNLLPQYKAINEPRRTECGAPDYALVGKKDGQPYAYIEAKDLFDSDLRGVNIKGHKEQFDRYRNALSRVCFTDYLSFYFYVDGELTECVELLRPNGKNGFDIVDGEMFVSALTEWADCGIQPITTATRLAEVMAHKAKLLAEALEKTLTNGGEDSEIHTQYLSFKTVLISDLSKERFADLYAQTIVYGMFAARLNDDSGKSSFQLDNNTSFNRFRAASLIPISNEFLRKVFQAIATFDLDQSIAWIVNDLAEAFASSDVQKIMGKYQSDEQHSDPLIHFYEDFLAAYDPKLRKACGVYYTPQSVVSFIVRSIDEILVRDFGLKGGLADDGMMTVEDTRIDGKVLGVRNVHRVQILDPATGTGTFLAEAVRLIKKKFEGNEGLWPQYVKESLRPRLHGFELLMAPYTITHLKLDMLLGSDDDERLNVYLTNSLEPSLNHKGNLLVSKWLVDEGKAATMIKNTCPVMVMMGNPPYSVSSANKGEWITRLTELYKANLNERNIQPLSDDYIKFIRLGQYYIEKNKSGVFGVITNNSYLSGLIHRQMRKSLMQAFDEIYIVNLHGNSRIKETCPDGSKDENVFDIMQGVAIAIFIKYKEGKHPACQVKYTDLYGLRKDKYSALDSMSVSNVEWKTLECTVPNYFFVPKDFGLQEEYEKGVKLDELFVTYNSGLCTEKDNMNIFFTDQDRLQVLDDLKNMDVVSLCNKYGLKTEWVQKTVDVVNNNESESNIIQYRPFDIRYTNYYAKQGLMGRPRYDIMCHMVKGDNIGLISKRGFSNLNSAFGFITNCIVDRRSWTCPGTQGAESLFPLYKYTDNGERHINMNPDLLSKATSQVGGTAEDFFSYIYSVLHSPEYRERYKEFLKIDFPRVPVPTDKEEYQRLVETGKRLIDLHLMRCDIEAKTTYPVAGNNVVDGAKYEDGKVYINKTQYFDNVPETVWSFYIGGYQPAQKWLKDRKGRTLGLEDIRHYMKMAAVMEETGRIMKEEL